MAYKSISDIKSKFENGDLPTGDDFVDLIDSCYNSVSGFTGIVSFLDNSAVTNTVTISSGMISNWVQA